MTAAAKYSNERLMTVLLAPVVSEKGTFIADKYDMPAERAVLTQDVVQDLYELLTECFWTPVLLPQLESSAPDGRLLACCWDFVEEVVAHSSEHVRGAVYFEVLEQLLNPGTLVEDSWPYMKERTRARTLRMLDHYEVFLPGINRR